MKISDRLEDRLVAELEEMESTAPERMDAGPEDVESALARLVLMLIEFIRQVLERQAIRRMEGDTLSPEEVERLGLTLMRLGERMEELKELFDLEDRDLRLDLGPIGRVI